jgi:hypothetical protein
LIEASKSFSATVAAEMGLSVDLHNLMHTEINNLANAGMIDIARRVYKKFEHELVEVIPRTMVPSSGDILCRMRDIANAWLRRVEQAAA